MPKTKLTFVSDGNKSPARSPIDGSKLSDDALRFWGAYFLGGKNTLRFGGDHAEMEITPEARAALDELIAVGAVKPIEPDDQWPNREHYGSTDVSLHEEIQKRAGDGALDVMNWMSGERFVTFRKKASA